MTKQRRSFDRAAALDALRREHFDVVVVGGGITGAGVALDAAQRGASVALIEANDFASGTSSKSSKLIHGGLRYLQQRDFALVYEALHERQRLLRNAPHLVEIQPFLLPVMGKDGVIPPALARAVGTVMWLYDIVGGWRLGRRHRRVSATEAAELFSPLRSERLGPSYVYYDCRADDARLCLGVIRTAVLRYGAVAANRVRATGLQKTEAGVVSGVDVTVDGAGGDSFTVSTSVVVNATGVATDTVRAWDEATPPHSVRPAKGVHVVVPRHRLPGAMAVVLPVPKDRRSIFCVPLRQFTYIGTTDTDYEGPLDDPECTEADVEYLLRAVNASTTAQLERSDVIATWAGLRPLVADRQQNDRTADLSRGQSLLATPSGVVSISGGKLTTYRQMAQDTVDLVFRQLGRAPVRCATAKTPIVGAVDPSRYVEAIQPSGRNAGMHPTAVEHLARRYGSESGLLIEWIRAEPALGRPIHPDLGYLRAEVRFAARFEMATAIADVLQRRTRAAIENAAASDDMVADVAALMAAELGWDAATTQRNIDEYLGPTRAPAT